jgi:predicted ATPase
MVPVIACVLEENSQFIITTHSPILPALPDATILSFDRGRIRQVKSEQLEHVRLTQDFLDSPGSFLRHL